MKAARRRNLLLGALCLGLLGLHCSTLVAGELERVRCTDPGSIGPPACEVGQTCGLGRCVACAQLELCGDAVDNDCNGQTDEGCGAPPASGGSGGAAPPREGDTTGGTAAESAGGAAMGGAASQNEGGGAGAAWPTGEGGSDAPVLPTEEGGRRSSGASAAGQAGARTDE